MQKDTGFLDKAGGSGGRFGNIGDYDVRTVETGSL
jgi:hypothetical protein